MNHFVPQPGSPEHVQYPREPGEPAPMEFYDRRPEGVEDMSTDAILAHLGAPTEAYLAEELAVGRVSNKTVEGFFSFTNELKTLVDHSPRRAHLMFEAMSHSEVPYYRRTALETFAASLLIRELQHGNNPRRTIDTWETLADDDDDDVRYAARQEFGAMLVKEENQKYLRRLRVGAVSSLVALMFAGR